MFLTYIRICCIQYGTYEVPRSLCQVGFKIFKVDDSAEELTSQFFSYKRHDNLHRCVAKTPTWQDGRETNVRVRLPAAKYCVVPCTFMAGKEGDFILRVHIERYSREVRGGRGGGGGGGGRDREE